MPIIKLNAIDSTNSFLREMIAKGEVDNYTIIVANSQSKGRGQMGASWHSEPGKNLTASVSVDVSFLPIYYSFWISMVMSLALSKTLKDFQISAVKVKWPNDMLTDQKKISGVLIDNVIKNSKLQTSIIGFGLNVNQVQFDNLPLATSMKNVSGRLYDLDAILNTVLVNLKYYMSELKAGAYESIKGLYENQLFRKEKYSTFETPEGVLLFGFIKGVSPSGHLQVLIENDNLKEFGLKQIKLIY